MYTLVGVQEGAHTYGHHEKCGDILGVTEKQGRTTKQKCTHYSCAFQRTAESVLPTGKSYSSLLLRPKALGYQETQILRGNTSELRSKTRGCLSGQGKVE